MGFEIKDGKEHLPDEEDIYGVNDAEEREAFHALFGITPLEKRLRRRRIIMGFLAAFIIVSFGLVFAIQLRSLFGW